MKTKSDYEYMKFLNDTWTKDIGINSLYFTCDNDILGHKDHGSLDGVLMVVNLYGNGTDQLNTLKSMQPNRSLIFFLFFKLILM